MENLEKYPLICEKCGSVVTVMASDEDVAKWQEGELIQNALPYLNADEREMFQSGTCAVCWDKIFEGYDE